MIRVGVIGLGFGSAVHLPALRSLQNVEVVAVGARRPEKALELASLYGIPVGGTLEDVLAARLDALTVALPPDVGAHVCDKALDSGIAVLAEKPLADTANRASSLALKAKCITTAVDFQLGELQCFLELKRLLQGEARQGLRRVRVKWCTHSFAQRQRQWSWKTDQARHGGVMNLLGSHVFYLLEWLLGPLQRLAARYSSERTRAFAPPSSEPAEDRALVSAETMDGVLVEVELDNAAAELGHRWTFDLRHGTVMVEERWHEGRSELVLLRRAATEEILLHEPSTAGQDWRIAPFSRLARRFVAAVEVQSSCVPDFAAGARVQYLLELAASSARQQGVEQRVAAIFERHDV